MSAHPRGAACRAVRVASAAHVRVDHCAGCGCVTVHLGPLSFRLDPDALRPLAAVLLDADARLRAPAPTRWGPPGGVDA
jgi:hypothetical protein